MNKDEMDRECSMHGRDEKYKQTFGHKPEEYRPLRRPRHRWKIILECVLGK
jgi:hypothetical protein